MNPPTWLMSGSGRLPDQLRAELTRKGLPLLEEGLSGSITRRRLVVVWVARSKYIDLPVTHRLRHALAVVAERPDRVLSAWQAAAFDKSKTSSGREEVRLRIRQADRVVALWNAASPAG